MKKNEKNLMNGLLSGDRVCLSRLISIVESDPSAISRISRSIKEVPNHAYRIGMTGPPGAGKSTLTNKIIARFREKKLKIGVIAVDPSSPFTGGAVLGDRIRMQEHTLDNGVFIRSIGSRGDFGGLSNSTSAIIKLFDIFGMDIVIIETVGVGQTELGIIKISDCVIVTLVPESGDSIQAMKAGLMEIGDIFIVNKSDRGGAEKLAREIDYMISLKQTTPKWRTKVLTAQAENDIGINEIMDEIKSFREFEESNGSLLAKRSARKISDLDELLNRNLKQKLERIKDMDKVKKAISKLKDGKLESEDIAELIFDLLKRE